MSFSIITYAPVNSQSSLPSDTALVTQILDISLKISNDRTGYTEYIFEVIGEVWNNNENSFSIEHPDTCGFGVYINPIKIEGDATVYSSISCGDAITPITYPPGATSYLLVGGIIVQSDVSTSIPNGYYEITLGEPFTNVYQEKVTFMKTSMTVSEGVLTFAYSITDPNQVTTYTSAIYDSATSTTTASSTNTDTNLKTFSPTETPLSSEMITSENSDAKKGDEKPDVVSETLNFNFVTFLSSIFLFAVIRTFTKARKSI